MELLKPFLKLLKKTKSKNKNILRNLVMLDFGSAVIGGSFTLIGVIINEYFVKKRNILEEKEKTKNFVESINLEVNTLWDLYLKNIGKTLELHNEKEPFFFTYYAKQDYFLLYSKNTNQLGSIENKELREIIVRIYVKAKALLDTYQLNNEFIEKHELYHTTKNEDMRIGYYEALTEGAPSLKEIHFDLKNEVETLNSLVKAYKKEYN